MGRALHTLIGGNHRGWNPVNRKRYLDDDFDYLFSVIDNNQTFDDTPWNCYEIWSRAAHQYPNSKFILTIRDIDVWWKSMIKWYNGNLDTFQEPMTKIVYSRQLSRLGFDIEQMSKLNEQTEPNWKSWYVKRNSEVIKFFGHSQQLLIYNIDSNTNWNKLCEFLDIDVPNEKFPHLNKAK